MARVVSASSRVIYPPAQTVLVNGEIRRDVECVSVSQGGSLSPVQAVLRVPQAYAGDSLSWLNDASVVVTVAGRSDPIFRGFVVTEAHHENAVESRVSVRAVSPIGWMHKVYLGQGVWQAAVRYFRLNALTGLPTGWNLVAVLQQWFTVPIYPEDWKEVIDIGEVEALGETSANIPFSGLRFAATNYRDALYTILGQVPQLGIRERFTEEKTFLDFYLRNDPDAAVRRIVAPLGSTGPEEGALLTAFVRESDVEDIYSRAIGYGRPTQTQITIGTRVQGMARAQTWDGYLPLVPMWANATSYQELLNDDGGDPPAPLYHADEAAVIADPAVAVEGSPQFNPALRYHFRRYRLPDWVAKLWTIGQRNVYRTTRSDLAPELVPEEHIGIQVFVNAMTYEDGDGNPIVSMGSASVANYRLIPGAVVTEEGILELPTPALEVYKRSVNGDGDEVDTYDRVDVFVTLSISRNEQRPFWDTGVVGVTLPGLEDSGLVLSFINESVGYERIGTNLGEFEDAIGAFDWGSAWYDPKADEWQFTDAGSPVIVEDDLPFLAGLTESMLMERSKRRTDASVSIPACLFGYRVGDVVTLENRGIDGRRLTVNSVTWNLLDPVTMVSASDQVVSRFTVGDIAPQSGGAGVGRNLREGIEQMRDRATNAGGGPDDSLLDPFAGAIDWSDANPYRALDAENALAANERWRSMGRGRR